jgi:hypothetical protein
MASRTPARLHRNACDAPHGDTPCPSEQGQLATCSFVWVAHVNEAHLYKGVVLNLLPQHARIFGVNLAGACGSPHSHAGGTDRGVGQSVACSMKISPVSITSSRCSLRLGFRSGAAVPMMPQQARATRIDANGGIVSIHAPLYMACHRLYTVRLRVTRVIADFGELTDK